MSLYFLVAILLAWTIPSSSLESLNFTQVAVDKHLGLYYEPMRQIRFTKAEWRLITFIDMKKFESQKPLMSENIIKNYETMCLNQFIITRCSDVVKRDYIMSKYALAEKYIKQIRSFMIYPNETADVAPEMMKRSVPFGFIGSISKTLFGTLDADDAQYYNNEIDKLYNDQKNMTALIEKQIHVVKSEFHRFHSEIDSIKNATKSRDKLLADAITALNNLSNHENTLAFQYELQQWTRQQEIEIDNYVNNLQLIIEAVYFAKLGFIHPGLITPEILEESVNHFLQNTYTKNLAFPISLEEVRSGGLGKISRTAIGYHDGKLLLVMHVPLVDPGVYHLYRMHPFPIAQTYGNNEKGAAYIQPRTNYLIVSQEQDKYTLVHDTDLPHCQDASGYHICTPSYPLYEVSMQPICEISLITKHKNQPLDDCDIKMSKIFNPYWKQLHNMKGWLYSVPKEEEIHIECGDSWQKTISISGAGILSLKPGCYAHTVYASFMGYQVINQTTTYEFNPVTRLNVTKIFPEIANYEPLSVPYLTPDIPRITSSANVAGVLSYDATLDEIQKNMQEIGEHKREKEKQEKIVFWTIAGEITLAIGFLCYLIHVSLTSFLNCYGSQKTVKYEEPPVSFHLKNGEPSVNIHYKNNRKPEDDRPVYATPSSSVVF